MEVATLFLDRALKLVSYAPCAVSIFPNISTEAGRSLGELKGRVDYPDLKADAERVLASREPIQRDVRSDDGRAFLARAQACSGAGTEVAGLVVTFADVTELRRAEAAKHFLAAIVESSEDSVVSVDFNSIITSWNKAAERLYGYTARETIGKPITMLTLPEDLQAVLGKIKHIKQSEKVEIYDTTRRHKDGHEMNLEIVLSPVKDDQGRVIGVSTVARDVTERRKAEAALRESEEQFRRAIEEAPIPVIMQAEDGQVLQVSKTWTELTGYGAEEVRDFDAWLNRAYGPGADRVRDHVRKLFAGEQRQLDIDLEIHTATGETRHWAFSASAPGTLRDGRRFIVGMALDITERRQVAEELRQSQESLRLIFENARDFAIFTMDLERRVTTWNVGAERLVGFSEQEVIGKSGDIIFTEEDRAGRVPEKEAGTALAAGRAADERWHLRKDGSRFWASGSMTAMRDVAGNVIGFLKIFRDRTEAREAQQAVERGREELWEALQENERARAEVEAAAAAKDHFLAVLSHELRTPLTPVLMAVHSLRRRRDLPEDVIETAEMIRRNVQLEAHFIDDLLDVTRIARGKLEIAREPLDFHAVATHAVEIAQPDASAKEQKISVEFAATKTGITGDGRRLQQVIWNLLKNASKFSPPGTHISLRTYDAAGKIVFEVADQGIGIEPEAMPSIFDAFAQGSITITRKFGGLGLGLAIAKATAEAHGGQLRAESAGKDQGATFILELPLAPQG